MGTASDIGLLENDEIKVNPKDIERNDIMGFIYYGRISKVKPEDLLVEDLDRNYSTFHVQGDELIASSYSADRYMNEEYVTRTKIAEKFVSSFNRPFSVNFTKTSGDTRTLRGRLVSSEHLMGRSYVEDLDIEFGENRLRQVDHRTINWLIVDGTKYIVR